MCTDGKPCNNKVDIEKLLAEAKDFKMPTDAEVREETAKVEDIIKRSTALRDSELSYRTLAIAAVNELITQKCEDGNTAIEEKRYMSARAVFDSLKDLRECLNWLCTLPVENAGIITEEQVNRRMLLSDVLGPLADNLVNSGFDVQIFNLGDEE